LSAGGVEAEVIELTLRPAAACGVRFQRCSGGKLAAGAAGGDVTLEIGLAAKTGGSGS